MKDDRLLTLKDWIESFWNFQEEELKYLHNLIEKSSSLNLERILNELKERMKIRKAYYQIYKYLNWKDLPCKDLLWVESKLNEILQREEVIANLIEKFLDVLNNFYNLSEEKKNFDWEKTSFYFSLIDVFKV